MPRFAFNGGVSGVRRVPTASAAPGIWDLHQQNEAQRAGIWPRTGADPNFSSVSLLLHMDGSNGSTTFTDSSSNTLAITANGNAQISTAQSKFGGASGYFDGNADYIERSTGNAVLSFGTGDLTIEMWVYFNTVTANQVLYETGAIGGSGSRPNGFVWYLTSASKLQLFSDGNNKGASTTSLAANTWNHIALVRSGGVFRYYINGTQDATSITLTADFTDNKFLMGRVIDTPDYYLNAYVDELRVTKGVARYTANFTAPTAAFPDY